MKQVLLALFACLLVGMAAAQTGQSGLDKGPGFLTPDSPLYGLEVAADNVAISIGFMDAGSVAQERAAEAVTMQEQGNHQAAARAAAAAGTAVSTVRKGSGKTTAGIDRAIKTLNRVKKNVPPEAKDGINTAINSLERAKKIINSTVPPGGIPNGTPAPPTTPTPPTPPTPPTNGTPSGSDSTSTSLSVKAVNGKVTATMDFSASDPYTLKKNIKNTGGSKHLFLFTLTSDSSGTTSHTASLSKDFGSSSYTVEARIVVDGDIKSQQTVSGN